MRLTLDLDDGTGARRPIAVDADDDATVGAVAKEIADGLRLHDIASPSLSVRNRPAQRLGVDVPLASADIRSGDRIEIVDGRPSDRRMETGAATIVVESGPETGRRIEIGPGRHKVGRGGVASIVINDNLLSRVHFSVNVGDSIEVADEGSTNGVHIDGRVVTQPTPLKSGQRIRAGDSTFRIDQQVGALAIAAKGTIPFNRPPRVWKPFVGVDVEVPSPVGPKPKQRIPKAAALAPLLMAGVMIGLSKGQVNPASFVFMAMSPLVMLGSVFESRLGAAKDHQELIRSFRQELAQTSATLHALEQEERMSREVEAPGVGEVAQLIEQASARLWERSANDQDFLDVRLGVGELPLRTSLKFTAPKGAMPELLAEATAVVDTFRDLRSAPIVVKLANVGSLGLAGAQTETESVARALVIQLASLHSPADLVVAALLGPAQQERWEWMLWLPHVQSAASPIAGNHLPPTIDASLVFLEQLAQIVERRRSARNSYSSTAVAETAIVVIVDESIALERSRLNWLFGIEADLGVSVVWLGSSVSRMPKGCGAVADVPGGGSAGTVGWTGSGNQVLNVRFEGVPPEHAIKVAQTLAPIVDVTAGAAGGGALPEAVALVDVLGNREILRDSSLVLENWNSSTSLRAPVGRSGVGAFTIDMRTDGPHALIAGTTGAGKSELLQALIASLALNHSPRKVTFLLVDYKGGSALEKYTEFPHTVGLVTDLDTNQVQRALTSLKAELKHREHVLLRHRCKDLQEMESKGVAEAPPSLLLIVDEFAALAKEIPEFVDGVVDIAQRGRSLGIHLVLATQRPAGVITDNIRANTNLRIALRVADASESSDVIGSPVAASLSRTTPGRGIAKVGPQELVSFQGGYVGGHSAIERSGSNVSISDLGFGTQTPWLVRAPKQVVDPDAPTDLVRIIDMVRQATATAGIANPRRPWVQPLGPVVNLFDLDRSTTDGELVVGLLDEPEAQLQRPAIWLTEDEGNLAIFGSSGSGKSTALWTIASSISAANAPTPALIYGLDFAGRALEAVVEFPSVGSVIASDDHERITRLLSTLRATITERSEAFGRKRAGSLTDYRRLAPEFAGTTPRIFVLIDGLPSFFSQYDRIERGVWSELMPKLMAEGRAVGIHFVVTADRRSSIPNSVYSMIPQRIVLRMANDDDYGSLGVPYKVLTADSPDGRCLFRGFEMQIAVPGGSLRADEQALVMRKLAAQRHRQLGGFKAPAIGVLETEVARTKLGAEVRGAFARSGSSLSALRLPVDQGSFVVAGPMRSGKTSTLLAIAESLRELDANRPMFYCTGQRNTAANAPFWTGATSVEESAELIREVADNILAVETDSPPVVFLDDFHDTNDGDLGQAVRALMKVAKEYPVLIVAASDATMARRASTNTPLGELRQFKIGILLAPEAANGDGDILGAILPTTSVRHWPEGRGYLVGRGTLEPIQVGLPA